MIENEGSDYSPTILAQRIRLAMILTKNEIFTTKKQPAKQKATIIRKAEKISTGAENENWQVGDKVSHKKWGNGTVVNVKGSGEDMELDVAFPAPTGIKRLLAKFAPITKVT